MLRIVCKAGLKRYDLLTRGVVDSRGRRFESPRFVFNCGSISQAAIAGIEIHYRPLSQFNIVDTGSISCKHRVLTTRIMRFDNTPHPVDLVQLNMHGTDLRAAQSITKPLIRGVVEHNRIMCASTELIRESAARASIFPTLGGRRKLWDRRIRAGKPNVKSIAIPEVISETILRVFVRIDEFIYYYYISKHLSFLCMYVYYTLEKCIYLVII